MVVCKADFKLSKNFKICHLLCRLQAMGLKNFSVLFLKGIKTFEKECTYLLCFHCQLMFKDGDLLIMSVLKRERGRKKRGILSSLV